MDRLSILLTLMTGAVLTGTLTIAAFSLEFYAWWAVLSAAALGFALSWPAAYLISRRIKRQDGLWDETRAEHADGPIPKADAPEV